MINCLCDVLRIVWKACWIIVDVVSWLSCCELCNVMKMVISSLFVWTCHLHCSETWLWQVLCALRKNKKIKRMYHFEGRIARRDGYYISRDVSRAATDTIFRGTYRAPRWLLLSRVVSRAAMDAWTDMSPMGPGLRDSGCVSLGQTCITILDIAFHCIALLYYWWTWSCVLLILWVPFYGTCDWWILSLLLKICNC